MKKFRVKYSYIQTGTIEDDIEANNEDDAKKKFIAKNLPHVYAGQIDYGRISVKLIEE